jgi:hypothetical protein
MKNGSKAVILTITFPLFLGGCSFNVKNFEGNHPLEGEKVFVGTINVDFEIRENAIAYCEKILSNGNKNKLSVIHQVKSCTVWPFKTANKCRIIVPPPTRLLQ